MRDLGQELDESLIYTRSSNHQVPLHLQLACFDGTDSSYMKHRDNATGVGSHHKCTLVKGVTLIELISLVS